MKEFFGHASNGDYSVGCTGQTVYLYDKSGVEITKFKNTPYGYTPILSPDGKLFVVKSADGLLAVYSLETFSLIKKFRFTNIAWCQDLGCCFSPDGKLFFNLERQIDDWHSALSVYDTSDFFLVHSFFIGETQMLTHIEFDTQTDNYHVLGFRWNDAGMFGDGFIAKWENGCVKAPLHISQQEYDFQRCYHYLALRGFTEKAYEWLYIKCKSDELQAGKHSLAKLYAQKQGCP